jgi:DNA-3-methyladenine glycosylase II
MPSFTFSLYPVPPFRLDLTAWALRRRPDNRTDRFDKGTYSRILSVGDTPVEVSVSQKGASKEPRVKVHVSGVRFTKTAQSQIAATIEKAFGMRTDLSRFYGIAKHDPRLGLLADKFLGLKPPRFPTAFEAAVNGIACQQLSLNVGIMLLNRLSEACALCVHSDSSLHHAFPRPQDLVKLSVVDLRGLGFSTRKAQFLLELARAVTTGELDLEGLAALGRQEAIECLTRWRGIGRWTAEYVLLRGLGDLSAFPGDDVGGRNRLRSWLGIKRPLSYEDVQIVTSKWKPYPGLIYFHLLLDGLSKEGYVSQNEP